MQWVAVVRFAEVALKGRNRPTMVGRLARNIQTALDGLARVYPHHDRIYIPLPSSEAWPQVAERLGFVPGLRNYSLALRTSADPSTGPSTSLSALRAPRSGVRYNRTAESDTIGQRSPTQSDRTGSGQVTSTGSGQATSTGSPSRASESAGRTGQALDAIMEAFRQLVPKDGWSTFRIVARRADKSFPLTSPEIEQQLGAAFKAETGAQVRLSREADLSLYVEIRPEGTYCYTERWDGLGGLPVGVSGRVVALISGGIDSPVASFMMIRRGCQVVFVHCHAYPYLDNSTIEKTKALVRHLTRYQNYSRLYLVPIGDIQRQVVVAAPEPLRVVLYRRFMARIAQEIARREGALGLVTGESLGQVASQTLRNLGVIESAVDIPILRPFLGMDKEEIVGRAQDLGTYETSIEPDQDCCQLFVPRHPATGASLEEVLAAETALNLPTLLEQALSQAEELTYRWPEDEGSAA